MKKILIIVFLLIGVFLLQPTVNAQAECDACGYCIGRPTPGNWESCRSCVYPNASKNAGSNQTLEIKQNTKTGRNEPITKAPGKTYTQLGCLDVGSNSFSDPSAPGGVLNFLLTKLIFPIVGTLSFISLVYGAFLLITAQGAPEQISRGKSYIVGAIVGLIFTLSAVLLVNIIAGDLLRIPGFSTAPQIKIQAYGTKAVDSTGTISYPEMRVFINNELKETFIVDNSSSENKEFTIPFASNAGSPTTVKIEFTNDFDPPNVDPVTGTYGDRNLFIKKVSSNMADCVGTGYYHQASVKPGTYPVQMWWTGYFECTIPAN